MSRYEPKRIEPRWQAYWDEHGTFAVPDLPEGEKFYALDMFPYPSGNGLHVGHPEGYTATDIVCRYQRMRGIQVMHPMGWDAFGLPAEQHAIKTGTPPQITTQKNIDTFRRQLKSLGFSYDWSREVATCDPDYFRWTQWIFLELFDTWYDAECEWTDQNGKQRKGRGRPIAELPVPDETRAQGDAAVRKYQDRHRLAYQHEAPVNWCPALGTVLANEEIIDGKSERGQHPVERIPLRQWMLAITRYAERLLDELDEVDWPESIKLLQRNWIGRSEGAEVDFYIGPPGIQPTGQDFDYWKAARTDRGFVEAPRDDVIRVYTTRPDTLYGATYMVLAPEHPYVDRLTTSDTKVAVEAYRRQASLKSDLDRTDLAKEKTGVFTGSYAWNPVNGKRVPIWIADYVLASYGTGAIMAVPAHDERDWEFAVKYGLPITCVILPSPDWIDELLDTEALTPEMLQPIAGKLRIMAMQFAPDEDDADEWNELGEFDLDKHIAREFHTVADWIIGDLDRDDVSGYQFVTAFGHNPELFGRAYTGEGTVVNSGDNHRFSSQEFKKKITTELSAHGLARKAVNYRLRDWLFSRQHFWGEPFPIWHELDVHGNPTGLLRHDAPAELPVRLPEKFEFKPHSENAGKRGPEPPLAEAPAEWLFRTDADGMRLKRETNTMPQWAGSCWYFLRFLDPKNEERFVDPEIERRWMPVDLYVGGAEHAVLHLLYSRFWHKVLFDRGHVSTPEPFRKLVNQGMILGEAELTGYRDEAGEWVSAREVADGNVEAGEPARIHKPSRRAVAAVSLEADAVEKQGDSFVLKERPEIVVESRAFKMSKARGNVVNPDEVVETYSADALRLYEMFMGPLEQVKPWSMSGVEGVYRFLGRVWRMFVDERADDVRLDAAVREATATDEQLRILHRTIKAVTDDIEKLSFNTAISRMMEFTNELTRQEVRPRSILEPFTLLLSPFAPHLAEELWSLLGHDQTLAYEPWPEYDPALLVENEIEVPVQVNGKLRGKVKVSTDADQATIEQAARADETIARQLEGKQVIKAIVVPGRLVNFVVR